MPNPYDWEKDDYLCGLKRIADRRNLPLKKKVMKVSKKHAWTIALLVIMCVLGVALGVALGVTILWAVATYRGEVFDMLD